MAINQGDRVRISDRALRPSGGMGTVVAVVARDDELWAGIDQTTCDAAQACVYLVSVDGNAERHIADIDLEAV